MFTAKHGDEMNDINNHHTLVNLNRQVKSMFKFRKSQKIKSNFKNYKPELNQKSCHFKKLEVSLEKMSNTLLNVLIVLLIRGCFYYLAQSLKLYNTISIENMKKASETQYL